MTDTTAFTGANNAATSPQIIAGPASGTATMFAGIAANDTGDASEIINGNTAN